MGSFSAGYEATAIPAKPGKTTVLRNPLNQGDSLDISIDWTQWLSASAETVSSASWSADSGITVSGASVSTPTTSCTLTAGNTTGFFLVQCQITTSGAQKRSVAVRVEIVDLQ